jgi:hypothetical protein
MGTDFDDFCDLFYVAFSPRTARQLWTDSGLHVVVEMTHAGGGKESHAHIPVFRATFV